MNRYAISLFDASTYVVFDQLENKEICVCTEYADSISARRRAEMVVSALNKLNND